MNEDEMEMKEDEWKTSFPQCIGAVDGTPIKIVKPLKNSSDFINRYRAYSMNVHGACDYNYSFFNVAVKLPRSIHDARVFMNSKLCRPLLKENVILTLP